MPCLIELGAASAEIHEKIGRKIAEVCDLAIITTKDRFKEIVEGARLRPAESETTARREIEKNNILFLENPKEIFEKIKSFCSAEDVVLLESRAPKEVTRQLIACTDE